MADWTRPFEASYSWWRVPRSSYEGFYDTGTETEQVDGIVSATLELNDSTTTFEGGTAECVGTLDLGTDLLRCKLHATWEDGTTETVVLGTYDVSVPSHEVNGSFSACTATLDGRLVEMEQDAFETPYVVPKGMNGWSYAASVVRGCGLTFAPSDGIVSLAKATTRAYTFGLGIEDDEGANKLSAYNTIMTETQNARAAKTDPYGRVMLQAPVDYDVDPVWTFTEGANATFLADATDEFDTTGVCNVVVCVYETSEATVVGVATDTDQDSPWSIANYGRRKVAAYTFNEGATQAQANAHAAELLQTNRSVVRRVTISHVWCGARVGDIVALEYPSAGISGKFAVRKQAIGVGSAGCLVTSELRRFERA